MAKDKQPSLWGNKGDDDEDQFRDAAQRPGPRPNPDKVFYSDSELDDRGDEAFGGFGYSGRSSGYDYREAFDDSGDHWYRRNSFRYSRKVDYSPSSLFRSAFSLGNYRSSDDNDAKNKAIRALRTLTRNANTIVDKAVKKSEFVVQFSAGTDSNGTADNLNEDKQRVVYVSPDQLLETKTTDDEDAALDALTGFVLMRVQIAQGVTNDIITQLNKTNARNVVAQLAVRMNAQKKPLEDIEHAPITADIVDNCLAGMLVKSMLMRLARRQVVSNWGGFAPYFVRHAKQFVGVKENLEKAELTLETLVGRVAYNMIADEEQITLDAEVETLTAKHLGAEIDNAALLPACKALVKDLRAMLVTSGASPAGEMEAALNEMVEKAKEEQRHEENDAKTREMLKEALAGLMDGLEASGKADSASGGVRDKSDTVQAQLRDALAAEQIVKRLKVERERLAAVAITRDLKDPLNEADCGNEVYTSRHEINYQLSSRPGGVNMLRKTDAAPALKALQDLTAKSKPDNYAGLETLQTASENFEKAAEKALKAQRAEMKEQAKKHVDELQKALEEFKKVLAALKPELGKRIDEIESRAEADKTLTAAAANTLKKMIENAGHAETYINEAAVLMNIQQENIAGARSTKTVAKAHSDATTQFCRAVDNAKSVLRHSTNSWGRDNPISRMMDAAREHAETVERFGEKAVSDDWQEKAIDAVSASERLSDAGFMANAVLGADEELTRRFLTGDNAANKAFAEELGISLDDLRKLIEHISTASSAHHDNAEAIKLGKELREKTQTENFAVSPVDEKLFGEKIESKTKLLTGAAVGHVNDEARNDPEEEYIAYLAGEGNDAKPKPVTRKESVLSRTVKGGLKRAKEILKKHRTTIERIRNALQFQSGKRTEDTYGLRSGDLDEGSLHKLSYDCDHIWTQKTISRLPDVAVGILVDQSGSMGGLKIDRARELCIVLAEALKNIQGVRLYIYGHTANVGSNTDMVIFEHYAPGAANGLERLGDISAHCNNYDGYAVKDVAKRLALDPAKRKYLFVIADGLPAGRGYCGEEATKHVASVCKFVRNRLKIATYAFAVGLSKYEYPMFKKQYGDEHVVFVDDIMKCLPQIVRFLRNTLQKEKKLVGVE
jgi:uncharacterized protein with von Willebrand factor type A (vWA) domain